MARQAMLDTQCDRCFELATSSVNCDRSDEGQQLEIVQPAVVHCMDCVHNLCTACCHQGSLHCTDLTSPTSDVKRHTVIDIHKYLQRLYQRDVIYCDLHPDESVDIYCFECRAMLCTICNLDGGHRIHRCTTVERAASEFQHQLEGDVGLVTKRYRQCRDAIETVERERKDFVDDVQLLNAKIRKKGEELKRLVDDHVTELLDELDDIRSKALQNLDAVREELDRFLTITDSYVRYVDTLRDRGTPLDITRSGHDLVARARTLQKLPFSPSGIDYLPPSVAFDPWFDLVTLLNDSNCNVVGNLTTTVRNADGNPVSDYCLNPRSVRTLHQDAKAVLGVATMFGHVIVARVDSPDIELYSAATWSLQRRLAVPGLVSPTDLVACESHRRVFAADWAQGSIHFVDVEDSHRKRSPKVGVNGDCESQDRVVLGEGADRRGDDDDDDGDDDDSAVAGAECPRTSWKVGVRPWSLSLTPRNSVLVICDQVASLIEYTVHGSLVRHVGLSSELANPRHAVMLTCGQFVVSFGDCVCMVSADGRRVQAMHSNSRSGQNRIDISGRLAVDSSGHVIVLDVNGRRVVQLNADSLAFVREIVPCDDRLRYAARLCVDSARGRIYVADNELSAKPRLSIAPKFWGKTGRVVVYDTRITA